MDIKPIETIYNGYRFRSRLEARWAVFFDAAGIEYEYEPEGYQLSDGTMYLPDFYLPKVLLRDDTCGLFAEVKGVLSSDDINKLTYFEYPIVVLGQIPTVDEFGYPKYAEEDDDGFEKFFSFAYVDGDDYTLFFGKHNDGAVFVFGEDNDWLFRSEDGGIEDCLTPMIGAYQKARMARFEHGECG